MCTCMPVCVSVCVRVGLMWNPILLDSTEIVLVIFVNVIVKALA